MTDYRALPNYDFLHSRPSVLTGSFQDKGMAPVDPYAELYKVLKSQPPSLGVGHQGGGVTLCSAKIQTLAVALRIFAPEAFTKRLISVNANRVQWE